MRKRCLLLRPILLLLPLCLAACEGQKEVVHDLTELEANEILVVLDSQEINALKTQVQGRLVTYSVSVKNSDAAAALRLLVDNRLPRERNRGLVDIYPPGKGGLIPTKGEEKAKFLMGIQGEIESMLKILPGVVRAKVAIVLPDTSAIRDVNAAAPRSTASVAVVYNQLYGQSGPPVTKEEITALIASAVEDLQQNDVTVLLTENRPLTIISKKILKQAEIEPSGDREAVAGFVVGENLVAVDQNGIKDSKMLVWLFAFLAFLGLVLGIFGLSRAMTFRAKGLLSNSAGLPRPYRDANDEPMVHPSSRGE